MISIVEDDEPARDSLAVLLESAGFPVRSFASCEALLAAGPSDEKCLVLDIHMPGMSGLELLEELRRAGDERPVIVVTAYSTPATVQRARAAGAFGFLEKPFKAAELLDLIRAASAGT